MRQRNLIIFTLLAFITAFPASAQKMVMVGKGSYASYPPLAMCRTDEHGGDQSRYMLTRPLFITEREGEPLPTNDWWTDMIKDSQPFSGHLWSYPQYVQATESGVDVCFPDYWIQNGTEIKPSTRLHIGAQGFTPPMPLPTAGMTGT